MNQHDQLFADIAREHLAIPTLKPRISDALAFTTLPSGKLKRHSKPPSTPASSPPARTPNSNS
jgi:hypothetical protein